MDALYSEAQKYIPGGVNSPVRAFHAIGGTPPFIHSAKGAMLCDENQKTYIDYVGSWGPMILGHAHEKVVASVQQAAEKGLSYGAPTQIETTLAKKICQLMPSIEQIRFVNSGTEATMTAVRLARGATQRSKIIKFEGCYHGHSDSLLVKAGSGALTLGQASSAGIPKGTTQDTFVARYNEIDDVRDLFAKHPTDIAAVIVEPIAGNMNMIPGKASFLQGLRECCDHYGAVLIFDEVMSGFRVALGGAQALYAIQPDLTTLGKIIGGGLPVGAVGGRHEIMQHLAPTGSVYQAGTLSGNPLAMAAGLATLQQLEHVGIYEQLTQRSESLMQGFKAHADRYQLPFQYQAIGGMFGFVFSDAPCISHYSQVLAADQQRFKTFFHAMLNGGVYLAPSAFEAGFVSTAHTPALIEESVTIARHAFQSMQVHAQ